jgi:3',5'-cyclic AMP phosphodiesterase CpdA
LSGKTLVVPGNHDVCCLGARLSLGKKIYRQNDLEKAGNGLEIGNQETKFPWAREFERRIVVFGLNSNNLGNFTILSNSMGRIGHDQLLSFAEQLHKYRDIPVKLVVLHHCPNIPGKTPAKKRARKLAGRLARVWLQIPKSQRRILQLLCLSHGVKVIAHGHSHKAEAHIVNGVYIVSAPPTTEPISKTRDGSVYQFYTYTIDSQNRHVDTNLRTIQI